MHVAPALWIVWGVFAAILLVLLVYRGTISRYEEDQLFLDDITDRQHKEHDALIRRLNMLQPFLRALTGVTTILTATIIGLYAWDAIRLFTN